MEKMTYKMFQADAFAQQPFEGNPAAVILLDVFLDDEVMQNIAMENNLSETAYVVPKKLPGHYDLRWFTPTLEIDFCGHATLATAHILNSEYKHSLPYTFHTQVGELIVSRKDGKLVMDAPIAHAVTTKVTDEIKSAFPVSINEAFWANDNLYVVFENADDIENLNPDISLIKPLSDHGVGITAKGNNEYDCISRFFVPAQGIDEDPVTGSAHAAIGPFWAQQLGKTTLYARQASQRGGDLWLDIRGHRITISGYAVTYMSGTITL